MEESCILFYRTVIDKASKSSRNLIKFIILFITILFPLSTWAQIKSAGEAQNAVEISGIVLDTIHGNVLIGANIWISPKGEPNNVLQGFSTDATGRFRGIWSNSFAQGYNDFDINISYIGYTSLHYPLQIALQKMEQTRSSSEINFGSFVCKQIMNSRLCLLKVFGQKVTIQ